MKRVLRANPNTLGYWDSMYKEESAAGKARLDLERYAEIRRWVSIRQKELGRPPRILDVGCGLGDLAFMLHRDVPGIRYAGIDISPKAIEHSRTHCSWEGFEFHVADAKPTGFETGSFDLSFCGETLEHLNSPEEVLMDIARVTGDGGFVIITVPYRGRNRDPYHVWELTPEDLFNWGKKIGETVLLHTQLLPNWLSMMAVYRVARKFQPS